MTASYVEPCRKTLRALLDGGSVRMAVLATADGLPIAQAVEGELESDAVSAMSASLLAIADAMVGQLGDGDEGGCRQVVIESPDRIVALIHAGDNMTLAVVGAPGLNLGMVVSQAKHAVEKIVDMVASSADHAEIEEHRAPEGRDLESLVRRVLQEAAQARGG